MKKLLFILVTGINLLAFEKSMAAATAEDAAVEEGGGKKMVSNPPFYNSREELEEKAKTQTWAMGELAEILRGEGKFREAAEYYYKAVDTGDEDYVQIVGTLEERLGTKSSSREAKIAGLAAHYEGLASLSH